MKANTEWEQETAPIKSTSVKDEWYDGGRASDGMDLKLLIHYGSAMLLNYSESRLPVESHFQLQVTSCCSCLCV